MCNDILQIRILASGLLFLLNAAGSIASFVILQKIAVTKKENKIGVLFIGRNEICFILFGGFNYFSDT